MTQPPFEPPYQPLPDQPAFVPPYEPLPDQPTAYQTPDQPSPYAPAYPPAAYPPPQPGWYGAPQWYPPPPPPGRDGLAITSLVLGIIPVFAGVLGVGFGIAALRRIGRSGRAGRAMAWWGIGLGSAWLALVVAVAGLGLLSEPDRGADGRLITSGEVLSDDLRLHDCTAELPEGDNVATVDVVPCAEPHLGEVYETYELPAGAYPGDEDVQRLAEGRCQRTLGPYVGAGTGRDPGWDVFYLHPTRNSWRLGDRGIACVLAHPDGIRTAGSAEKAGAPARA